jgi:plastocyanin
MLARLGRGLIAAGVVLAALGSSNAFADQTFAVEMVDFAFRPNAYSVRVGEKITFQGRNTGQRPHDIRIDGPGGFTWQLVAGDANNVAAGASANGEATFTTAGTYEFYCPVGNHRAQGMTATFTVTAAAGAAAAPAAAPAPAAALPRTGEPLTLLGGVLAASGVLLTAGGLFLRRRA